LLLLGLVVLWYTGHLDPHLPENLRVHHLLAP